MPKFSTPAGSTQRYIPALDRSAPDSVPGTKKVYADRAAFLQGVADERSCIAMGLPVWFDGIDLQVLSEPLGAKRLWSLSSSAGSASANADASHGRTAVIGAFVRVLSSDSSRIHSTTGAPASGLGDNGDMAWDQLAGIIYEKASGAWAIVVSMYGSGGSSPVAPGAVQNLAPGTATANAQPLAWQAPATGTGPFTYQVAYRLGTSTGAYTNFGSPVSGLSATVTGLSAGTAYDYQVTAINAAGPGPAATVNDANTASASPVAPGAPTSPVATAGDGQASVTATPPSSNGGAAIDKYRVTPYAGSTAGTPVESATLPIAVTGLTNGTAYTFRVEAHNSAGWGAQSVASNSITPIAATPSPWSDIEVAYTANVTQLGDNQFAGTSSATSTTGRIVTNHFLDVDQPGWVAVDFPADGASSVCIGFDPSTVQTLPFVDNDLYMKISLAGNVLVGGDRTETAITPAHSVPPAATTRIRYGRDTDMVFKIQESTDSGETWTNLFNHGSATTAKYILRLYCTYSGTATPPARKIVHPRVMGMSNGVTPTV